MNKRESEPLDVIASWSEENARAVTDARKKMVKMIDSWNEHGSDIVRDKLGTFNHEGYENGMAKDNLISRAVEAGMVGMMETAWADIEPHEHGYDPMDIEEYQMAYRVLKVLRDNPNYITAENEKGDRAYDK